MVLWVRAVLEISGASVASGDGVAVLPGMGVVEDVCVGSSRLGARGLFHRRERVTDRNMTNITIMNP